MSMPRLAPAASCCRRDPLGDLGLHRPDGEAPAVGEHDDPVAAVGTPGEVVARVRHAAVVEPELTLLVGVTAHVGGAPHRDPPVVGRVGVRERQRHLLVGRLDVAERDEGPQRSSPTMIGRIVAPMFSVQPVRSVKSAST